MATVPHNFTLNNVDDAWIGVGTTPWVESHNLQVKASESKAAHETFEMGSSIQMREPLPVHCLLRYPRKYACRAVYELPSTKIWSGIILSGLKNLVFC